MANIIKMTPEIIEEAKSAFLASLASMRLFDGKISFQKTVSASARKATLIFSELAWAKMTSLVAEFSSEIGWHGRASRAEGAPDTYLVEDIYVYPQNVTSTTVTPDQKEYNDWLNSFDDDIFSGIRFHGHSHVNMATSPSGVDTGFWEEILSQLGDDDFYVFMIINKKWEKHVRIYDMKSNLYFPASDVDVKIRNDGFGIEALLRDARGKVKTVTYTPAPAQKPVQTTTSPVTSATGANRSGVQTYPAKKDKDKKGAKPFGGVGSDDWYDSICGAYGYGGYGGYNE